ncbi:hypothetical protein I6G82_02505 [Lysinibacillus macroides]|uniref:Uncharacterized protein n=1 Tax=Lysinibacillus macroides TaxID=33935 RepID=A0A0M9DII8_9BACI|nr:hypothetical protein [Lysinibacillus macroides]KOY81313.1 hypothetical protein ADM90_19465 [Lysinibacillus macroides]QPR68523.1 hypothetical protein I6G82_02505 [Lysinibacillus macroides]
MNDVPHRVLLPQWIFDQAAGDETELYRLVRRYMWQSYPHYKIIRIEGSFAICERLDKFL